MGGDEKVFFGNFEVCAIHGLARMMSRPLQPE